MLKAEKPIIGAAAAAAKSNPFAMVPIKARNYPLSPGRRKKARPYIFAAAKPAPKARFATVRIANSKKAIRVMTSFLIQRLPVAAALSALALLAACGSGRSAATVGQVCPTVSVVSDTARMVQMRPGSPGAAGDVAFVAEVADYSGNCRTTDEDTMLVVEMTLRIMAERGPAAGDARSVNAPFYIAIANRTDQTILVKEIFNAQFDFKGEQRRAGSTEELLQRIPMPAGKRPGDFEILVGFQLTPEQLQLNRTRRGL